MVLKTEIWPNYKERINSKSLYNQKDMMLNETKWSIIPTQSTKSTGLDKPWLLSTL